MLKAGRTQTLTVSRTTEHGIYLADEEQAEVLLPNRYTSLADKVGDRKEVFVYHDSEDRLVATTKLKSFVNNDPITVAERQRVTLLVASESEIGYRVIVENRHWGMLYRNQLFRPVAVGDRLTGYVRRITGDNRIDVSLQQTGYAQVRDTAGELLQLLRDNGGFLPLNDDSSPEEIARLTRTSKKVFKRSLGVLLKSGEAETTPEGMKLRNNG